MLQAKTPEVGKHYKIMESFGEGEVGECILVVEKNFGNRYAYIRTPEGTYSKRAEDLIEVPAP